MAGSTPQPPTDPGSTLRWRPPWLGFLGGGLALALLAVVAVQARQYALLRQAFEPAADVGVLIAYATENDYLRLRAQWQAALDGRTASSRADIKAVDADEPEPTAHLRQSYRDWVAQLTQLRQAASNGGHINPDALRQTLALADGFIAAADRGLGEAARVEPSRAFLLALLPALNALDTPLHALCNSAALQLSTSLPQRHEALRLQNRLGLALTGFLSLLTLAFAALALRQVRQLHERRVVLEDLARNLRDARHQADAASAAKSAFLANMSHEIRTPFHGLMGMLSLLRETGLTPRQVDFLRAATESADHLLALLNDILDMSQLETGRMTLSPAAVDLRALLREIEALMRPQALAKQLVLHLDADPAVPEQVWADGTRVKQIVFNLLSNAIKFSQRGAVVLDLRCRHDELDREELIFVVTDTGPGMDEATQAQLFNRFMQGDSSRSRRHGGSGLGLEISRTLARLMGGDITVRSRPGEGSRFTFQMPVVPAPASRLADNLLPGMPKRALQVLVAEDHPVNRQYMAAVLESMGHQAHFTSNGQEAVQAARTQRFDLVLMDLHMPVMDGIAATRALRALPEAAPSTLPIVALTADVFNETRDRCLLAGMNDFLTKPVNPQKLAALLRRLFGAEATAEPGPPAAPLLPEDAVLSDPPLLLDKAVIGMSLQSMSGARLAAMIADYLDQGPDTVQRLRAAVRDAQPLELRVNAHAAKGAALNLGLSGLAATAQALHEGAAHLPAHEIARLVQRFEELLPQTRLAVASLNLAGQAEAATATR